MLPETKKWHSFHLWYQKWGPKVANALLESRILIGMTKEQVIESIENPLSIEKTENVEVLHYQNRESEYKKIRNLIFEDGILIKVIDSYKVSKLGFSLKVGMTQKEVEEKIGVPDQVGEKKIKVGNTQQKFIMQYYHSVLRSKESEPCLLRLYFDKDSGLLVREETVT